MASGKLRSINSKQAAKALELLFEQHLMNNVNAVYAHQQEVSAFGKYKITKKDSGCLVQVNKIPEREFGSLRTALSWCIADKYNIPSLKSKIQDTDLELSRRNNDLLFYKNVLTTVEATNKSVAFDRFVDCQIKITHLKKKLDKCIESAKYWQRKGFENETSRLGLQKPTAQITKGF